MKRNTTSLHHCIIAKSIALALSGVSFSALAEDHLQLDELVVSASGFEQKLTEAPASISVLTREELQQKRFSNIAEALADVEGIDVRQGTGKTGGLNISFRGMPSEYTLILIDGRRQNIGGSVTPNGFGETATSFMPPVSAIERIEVIRGPMSTLYGSDAMGGVINIITRKVAKEWGTSLTVDRTFNEDRDYGDDGKISIFTSGPIVEDTLGLSLFGNIHRRDASNLEFENGDTVSMRGAAPVEGQNYDIGARLTLTPNTDHDLSLEVQRGRQVYDNENCQLGTLDGFKGGATNGCTGPAISKAGNLVAAGYSDELRFERDQIALSHTGRFAIGTLTSSLSHSTTETLGRTLPGDIGVVDSAGMLGGGHRILESTDLIFDTKLVTQLNDAHRLTVGGQYWDAELEDGVSPVKFDRQTWALFAEDEWRIRDDLALTFGGRYDHHDQFGSHVSPRAYLVWNTNDNWTMKGGVSKAYKAPSMNDLVEGPNSISGQGRTLGIGSPDLKPEESTTTEIGVYYDNYAGFNANATLFHNQFDDKIGTGEGIRNCAYAADPNLPGCRNYGAQYDEQKFFSQSINIDEAVTQGLELAGRWEFLPTWSLAANYTFTHSEQKSGDNKGRPLTNTPKHMLNSTLNWEATPKLALYLKAEYRGERERFLDKYMNLESDQVIHDVEDKLKAYTVLHLGGAYKLSEKTTLSATVYNLLDKDFLRGQSYSDGFVPYYINSGRSVDGTAEQGRRLWVSISTEF